MLEEHSRFQNGGQQAETKGRSGGGAPSGVQGPLVRRSISLKQKLSGACTSIGVGKLAPFLTDPNSPARKTSIPGTSSGKRRVDISPWRHDAPK